MAYFGPTTGVLSTPIHWLIETQDVCEKRAREKRGLLTTVMDNLLARKGRTLPCDLDDGDSKGHAGTEPPQLTNPGPVRIEATVI